MIENNVGESSRSAAGAGLSEGGLSGNGNGKGKGKVNGSSSGSGNGGISPGIDFTAGVIAGAAGLVVGQPFDVVKVRYQTPRYAGRYSSTFSALGAIVKEEKVKGLFKGVTSPMINGVVFTSYSFFMKLQLEPHSEREPGLGQIFLAGAGSGFIGAFLTCPTELIKIRQQSAPPHVNTSTLNVVKSIIRTDGLRGLFRGFSATAMRDLAYGPYFCTYEAILRFFKWTRRPPIPPNTNRHEGHTLIDEAEAELASGLSWAELMTAGGIAGVTAWLATFPLDVLKTRLQGSPWPTTKPTTTFSSLPRASAIESTVKTPSLRSVAVEAVRREGWRVMFAGLGPTLIRMAHPYDTRRFIVRRLSKPGPIDSDWLRLDSSALSSSIPPSWSAFPDPKVRKNLTFCIHTSLRPRQPDSRSINLFDLVIRAVPTNMVIFLTFEACVAGLQ
ncbi:hypothetical protein IAR55_004412 [Kwoniella newhampshirensis]|uniref:Carnitine/acyl carnitine carrier n=1 Tax=Kwoniella newhampshirensis TaxID=1651941 RepID=A0AAW0YWY4_9TREE